MKRTFELKPAQGIFPILLVALFYFAPVPSAKALEKIFAASSTASVNQVAYYIAKEKGYFVEEGLDVVLVVMSTAVSSKALISKDIDFSTAGSPGLNTAIAGFPTRGVFTVGDSGDMFLFSNPNIKTVKDLKGKSIAIGTIGGIAHQAAIKLLRSNGLAEKDVTFMVMGGSGARLAALKGGTVAAVPLSTPQDVIAKRMGFSNLAYIGDLLPSFKGGVGVHLDSIKQRPNVVEGFVKASLKGLMYFRAHHKSDEVAGIISKHTRLDRGIIVEALGSYSSLPDGILSQEKQKQIIDTVAQELGIKNPPPPEQVFDFSFAQKAKEELTTIRWKP